MGSSEVTSVDSKGFVPGKHSEEGGSVSVGEGVVVDILSFTKAALLDVEVNVDRVTVSKVRVPEWELAE